MIIDWKALAKKIYNEVKNEISSLEKKPTLWAILVWDNPSSLRYIGQKKKWADYTWINFDLRHLEESISEEKLLEIINDLNTSSDISWYIIQLPLPNHINPQNIIEAINPQKDVDGFCPENVWKVTIWDKEGLVSCTPAWIMNILNSLDIDLEWKLVTIIGRSNIVWKPTTILLMNAWATVVNCNSKTKDISEFTKKSDIVICATWKPWLLKKDMIGENTIVIDVWFTVVDGKIYWDALFDSINKEWNMITPVPGWVGPLTVANLIKNTLKAHKTL